MTRSWRESGLLDNELRVIAYEKRAGRRLSWAGGRGFRAAEISAIETGRLVPSTAVALALADAFGSAVEALFKLQRGPAVSSGGAVVGGAVFELERPVLARPGWRPRAAVFG